MSSTQEQISPLRKRQRSEAASLDELSEAQLSKRFKPSTKFRIAAFYDSLSKVSLTRRALKELHRRTRHANRPEPPASTPRHVARNTSDQIKRFARQGGPDLRDLRGYPVPRNVTPTMISSRSSGSRRNTQTKFTVSTSTGSAKTQASSAYDADFEQHLIDHMIYPQGYDYPDKRTTPEPPLQELRQRLAQRRLSISSSCWPDSKFKEFEKKNARMAKDADVMKDVVSMMCGNADIPNQRDLRFTRFQSMTDDTTFQCQPDFFDGARLGDINKQIRDDIGKYVIPTGHRIAPVLPNFFLEVKRPSNGADVAKRQACYDGAMGARAMHQLQSYGQDKPVYDGNAYTITSTYHAGQLTIYTTHPTQKEDGTTEYHMSVIGAWATLGDPNGCRQGLTRFRNARDVAKDIRDAFILSANERINANLASESNSFTDTMEMEDPAHKRASHIHTEPSAFESSDCNGNSDTTTTHPAEKSDNSADEFALDTDTLPQTSRKRRRKSSKQSSSKAPRLDHNKSGGRRHSER